MLPLTGKFDTFAQVIFTQEKHKNEQRNTVANHRKEEETRKKKKENFWRDAREESMEANKRIEAFHL